MKTLLALLVRLLPGSFRERHGPEVLEQVQMDLDRARSRGPWRAFAFATVTALDLARTALIERLIPSYRPASSRARPGRASPLSDLWADLSRAVRSLRRAPGFTALAAGTLGLALGALAGVFGIIDAVILRPLPYLEPDRVVFIVASAPGSERAGEFGVSPEMYLEYKRSRLLEQVAFQGSGGTRTLRVGDRAERVPMWMPSLGLFSTLGAAPILGRLPTPDDDGKVALISHRLWRSWFDSDPRVIGRTIDADGAPRTVIGVMGPDFWWLNDDFLLWLPHELTPDMVEEPGQFQMRLVARLKPGVSVASVSDELTLLARRLPERFGGAGEYARLIEQHRAVVRPVGKNLGIRSGGVLWMLFGSAMTVLMIACANAANLFLLRAERRRRDHAVVRALGGSRAHLLRVAFAESLVVSLLAAGVALVLARAGGPLLLRAGPNFERPDDVRFSTTLLFTLAASGACAVLSALGPALSALPPGLSALHEGGRGATARRHWKRSALVAAQTALALVLLIGSGLLVRSFRALHRVDLGFDTEEVLTFQVAPERADLVDGPSFARFHLELMERLAALRSVQAVGAVNNVPLDEPLLEDRFVADDRAADGAAGVHLSYTYSGGDYFAAMGIDVRAGRHFTRADHLADHGNVVISRSAAALLWPDRDPVGRRLRRADGDDWHTVVGLVEDVTQSDIVDAPPPIVYFPLAGPAPTSWTVTSPGYVVRSPRAQALVPEIRDLIRQVAPGAPMYAVFTMEQLASRELRVLRFTMWLLATWSVVALALSAVGLFGVLSYVVAERTGEIGVRMALGAEAGRVRRMVVAQGAAVVAAGVLAGLTLAALGTRLLSGLLFGVQPVDATTFATISVAIFVVGLLASYLPARRASTISPIEALRSR